ncbi:hypothetical protein PVK06_033306 [Gossypium arboreum]|uniref:Uncharacterized protein n=1 Tax=Gossypium arboreum TaxID=29729 RepID=A0ABR0NB18_GOSAR|nr:hypothetical protein PVK06_033306 [Gossypium arboreum]
MAVESRQDTASDKLLLEHVWANFIGGKEPNTAAEPSMETLERLPSLGRWISMGADAWEGLLDGIIPSGNKIDQSCNDKTSSKATMVDNSRTGLGCVGNVPNDRKRGCRDWEQNREFVMVEQPTMKRMASVAEQVVEDGYVKP